MKKFKSEVRQRTRRQPPISLGTLIKLLNPKIRGWKNYFEGCTKKWIFKELDEYTGNQSVQFDEEREVGRPLFYSTIRVPFQTDLENLRYHTEVPIQVPIVKRLI